MSGQPSKDPVGREALQGFPLEIFKALHAEMLRTTTRPFPDDMVRACALLCEEAGETIAEALDLDRPPFRLEAMKPSEHMCITLARMRLEAIQTASVAIKIALRAEKYTQDLNTARGV